MPTQLPQAPSSTPTLCGNSTRLRPAEHQKGTRPLLLRVPGADRDLRRQRCHRRHLLSLLYQRLQGELKYILGPDSLARLMAANGLTPPASSTDTSGLTTLLGDLNNLCVDQRLRRQLRPTPMASVTLNTVAGSGTTTYTNIPSGLAGRHEHLVQRAGPDPDRQRHDHHDHDLHQLRGRRPLSDVWNGRSGPPCDQITYNEYDDNGNRARRPAVPSAIDTSRSYTDVTNGKYASTVTTRGPTEAWPCDSTRHRPDRREHLLRRDYGHGGNDVSGRSCNAGGVAVGSTRWPSPRAATRLTRAGPPSRAVRTSVSRPSTTPPLCTPTSPSSTKTRTAPGVYIPPPTPFSSSQDPLATAPAIETETTTLPVVSTDEQARPRHGGRKHRRLQQLGQVVWSKDADGSISYTAYDPATGAVVEQIQDVNLSISTGGTKKTTRQSRGRPPAPGTSSRSTSSIPKGGRFEIDPDGNATATVYDDADTRMALSRA